MHPCQLKIYEPGKETRVVNFIANMAKCGPYPIFQEDGSVEPPHNQHQVEQLNDAQLGSKSSLNVSYISHCVENFVESMKRNTQLRPTKTSSPPKGVKVYPPPLSPLALTAPLTRQQRTIFNRLRRAEKKKRKKEMKIVNCLTPDVIAEKKRLKKEMWLARCQLRESAATNSTPTTNSISPEAQTSSIKSTDADLNQPSQINSTISNKIDAVSSINYFPCLAQNTSVTIDTNDGISNMKRRSSPDAPITNSLVPSQTHHMVHSTSDKIIGRHEERTFSEILQDQARNETYYSLIEPFSNTVKPESLCYYDREQSLVNSEDRLEMEWRKRFFNIMASENSSDCSTSYQEDLRLNLESRRARKQRSIKALKSLDFIPFNNSAIEIDTPNECGSNLDSSANPYHEDLRLDLISKRAWNTNCTQKPRVHFNLEPEVILPDSVILHENRPARNKQLFNFIPPNDAPLQENDIDKNLCKPPQSLDCIPLHDALKENQRGMNAKPLIQTTDYIPLSTTINRNQSRFRNSNTELATFNLRNSNGTRNRARKNRSKNVIPKRGRYFDSDPVKIRPTSGKVSCRFKKFKKR